MEKLDLTNLNERLEEFRERLLIDKHALEDMCQDQAILCREVGELYIKHKSETKRLKDMVEYIKAQFLFDIKQDPEKYHLTKPPMDLVNATIIMQKGYQDALREYNDMDEISSNLGILVSSVEQRKTMLKEMTSLFIYSYYQDDVLTSEVTSINKTTQNDIENLRSKKNTQRGSDRKANDQVEDRDN